MGSVHMYFYLGLSVCDFMCEPAVISASWFSAEEEAAWKLIMYSREKAPVKTQAPVRAKVKSGFFFYAVLMLV